MEDWECKQIEKHGFYIHYVPLEEGTANIHTHGLFEALSHKDLQIVLPIKPELASSLFHSVVERIKEGERFEDEGYYYNVISELPVYIQESQEMERTVMRIILPDPSGEFHSTIDSQNPYSYQKTICVN